MLHYSGCSRLKIQLQALFCQLQNVFISKGKRIIQHLRRTNKNGPSSCILCWQHQLKLYFFVINEYYHFYWFLMWLWKDEHFLLCHFKKLIIYDLFFLNYTLLFWLKNCACLNWYWTPTNQCSQFFFKLLRINIWLLFIDIDFLMICNHTCNLFLRI